MAGDAGELRISWVRILLLVVGILALWPVTMMFGFYGFMAVLFFLLLVALAT